MRQQTNLLAIIVVTAASALTQKSPVKGIVFDPSGAVITNAYILVRANAVERGYSMTYRTELRTNTLGEFATSLPAGSYDLFIGAKGFEPYCQRLRPYAGHPQDLRIVMRLDMENAEDFFGTPSPVETLPSTVPPSLQEGPR